jgi:magnesium-protoporphyrin IX monomethyl ester (oxidative) cyclase
VTEASAAAAAQGSLVGRLKRVAYGAAAALTFGRLYLLPTIPNEIPAEVRLAPAW